MLDNLRIALDARDVESFRRNALPEDQCHYLRATELGAQAKELETMARDKIWRFGDRLEKLTQTFLPLRMSSRGCGYDLQAGTWPTADRGRQQGQPHPAGAALKSMVTRLRPQKTAGRRWRDYAPTPLTRSFSISKCPR